MKNTIKTLLWTTMTLLTLTACGSKSTSDSNITESSVTLEQNTTTSIETNNTTEINTTTPPENNESTTEHNSSTVQDTIAPVLTLDGESEVALFQGVAYTEFGATATDERDGDVNVTIEGNVDTSTEGIYTINYTAIDKVGNKATASRTVAVVAPTLILKTLSLESNVTTLNVGERAELTVMGTYSDGSTAELDANVEYIITPTDSVEVNGTVLTAKKDGNLTVQAKIGTTLSNTLHITIAWIVSGHVLPPEPDKTLNDSTLLGIDTNNNGVRDDVERWIYEEYKYKHPIHIDIGMQAARASKMVLEHPEKAREIRDNVDGALFCGWYYQHEAEEFNDPVLVHENIDGTVRSKYFNTKKRSDVYWQYDKVLSGGVYDSPWADEMKAFCDFNTSRYGE